MLSSADIRKLAIILPGSCCFGLLVLPLFVECSGFLDGGMNGSGVSDEAKQKIVSNIVGALSDFVEIESQDKVELSVSTDAALGTIISVTVPVRRVKPNIKKMMKLVQSQILNTKTLVKLLILLMSSLIFMFQMKMNSDSKS
ncbi:hypothetical protein AG4045_000103 [Apium graveolens]|uniref:Uncharacterized protein n=1 Tax=Apium graveolens TaxID=4045 RepID=A0A6L5BB08_APIGR|nr:hypothetical protein AG4045_000103 [Apium graveolens]